MGRASIAALLLCGLTACAVWPLGEAGVLEGRELPRGAAVLVMAVPDVKISVDEWVENSGAAVVRATRRELGGAGFDAFSDSATTLPEAFAAARSLGCELVAQTEIIEWLDKGSEWVKGGDKLSVSLKFWSVADEGLVAWGANEVVDETMQSGIQPPHRLAEDLLAIIVEQLLAPGAEAPPFEER